MSSITLVTRDAIMDARIDACALVLGDNGAYYTVLANIDDALYVQGRHGNLARVIRTGNSTVSRNDSMGEVRARIDFAEDIGDAAGTLSFGAGEHIGARVSRRLLPIMARRA
jgi:hypothetical protein